MDDFPYPKKARPTWRTRARASGSGRAVSTSTWINDLESIRDWNLRAVFGGVQRHENKDGAAEHKKAKLDWIAYIGGPRESRRIMGDVLLTHEDIVFEERVPRRLRAEHWSIDLHFAKDEYARNIRRTRSSRRRSTTSVSTGSTEYPVPYRCLYSTNIATCSCRTPDQCDRRGARPRARDEDQSHDGEVVGKAAAVASAQRHARRRVSQLLERADELLKLPGRARRPRQTRPSRSKASNLRRLMTPVDAAVTSSSRRSKHRD